MVIRLAIPLVFAWTGFICALPANADCLSKLFYCIARDTKRRNCWPKPFVCPDRASVRAPFAIMVNNGWMYQNMLGEHYFNSEDGSLNEAGRIKVKWILTQAPQHHRSIYVCRADSPEQTAARMESIQQFALHVIPDGQLPPIFETSKVPLGWPAAQVDAIGRGWESSVPTPRLPETGGSSGASGETSGG